jgi:Family of unknown function (DUF5990)
VALPGNRCLAAEPVPGDAPSARREVPVIVRRDADGLDFSGPYLRGSRDDRHLYLAWGDIRDDGTTRLVRGGKLKLIKVDPRVVVEAMRPGYQLVARIRLTCRGKEPSLTLVGGTRRRGLRLARRPVPAARVRVSG